ncbi:AprI/Inh family metalloprotease inhibitor [Pelagibacterium xiamenense]|uniref:AprI/Inh family metalloprotease inhibitor n=1 Tax=Pelagibacterium xiamenense TaxID=2901140 RepID=UPI001E315F43|nr:AprI/Inh family metalloprotease inhibitor [Pelagibacterium xiamenense]MCD7058333.1 protease inhibitor Inh/omp19 family protein [Pelagibacterium xiamenense]
MIVRHKTTLALAAILVAGTTLAACSTQRFGGSAPATTSLPQPAPITPVQTGTVQSSDLPPIGGTATAASGATNTGLYDPSTQTAASGGFGTFDDVSGASTGGRDLTGPLTMEKLLGGWTLTAGVDQCRLNLTYTAKGATGRYRASTPGCTQETLAGITSWQLLGSQIQFYNEANELIGTVFKSPDNRLVGTLAGGQSITMTG